MKKRRLKHRRLNHRRIKHFSLTRVWVSGVCLISLLFSFTLSASTDSDSLDKKGRRSEASRNRNYPGGRDESDLQVQEKLFYPSTKGERQALEQKVLKERVKNGEDPNKSEEETD